MRGKNTFKRTDLRRAIDTVRRAGLVVETAEITSDGAIRIKVMKDGKPTATGNEWDAVPDVA